MYILDTYEFPDKNGNILSREYEYKYYGNYGAKGEKRLPKKKITPEQIAKQNQSNRIKRVRRKIKCNFYEGDYWVTLTYPKGITKPINEVAGDLKRFTDKLRRTYKAKGEPLKWIRRIEIGSRGGVHIHLILNRIEGLDILLSKQWTHGHVNIATLDGGTYEDLASYLVKEPTEQQLKLIHATGIDESKLIRYSCSRNLIEPIPEREKKSHATMRAIFNDELKPKSGFYIDKNSIVKGINYITGMGYLQYQEVRCESGQKYEPVTIYECPHCHQWTVMSLTCNCRRRKRHGHH